MTAIPYQLLDFVRQQAIVTGWVFVCVGIVTIVAGFSVVVDTSVYMGIEYCRHGVLHLQ